MSVMKRRDFITLLGGAASWPLAARAQPVAGKVPLIGFLQFGGTTENIAAFMQGLRDAGYIDGRSAIVEARYYDIDRVALALTREWSGGARRRRFVQ